MTRPAPDTAKYWICWEPFTYWGLSWYNVTRRHQLRFRIQVSVFDQLKSFRYFVHNLTAHIKVLHQICRMKFVSIPFSQLIRQWYVGLPLDTGTLIGLSLKITRSIMGYAMSLQRHSQKLFTSLSCVLLSLVLSLVIAFQKQTDLPQKQTAKQSGFFFIKISKESGKAWRKSLSASFQTFCLTARAYLNTQKYGLFCSQPQKKNILILSVT